MSDPDKTPEQTELQRLAVNMTDEQKAAALAQANAAFAPPPQTPNVNAMSDGEYRQFCQKTYGYVPKV
ncbi:hypothetical protein [Hyphomicrobium sp. D-2]|uniref:hypothetical protein n=1 Tax=Hyphomicrobium sp. D-2 TaxID=3041621 RepID=UPI002455EE6E|nr:hypothetical protein [Hyphomicrobium sp. D-2]MDH4983269.1 hypothetical protein [Hyphomicrobium sp. D-2]